MSIDLILEVMDHAPADLTSGERLTLIVIAERANDKTRIATQSTRWTLDVIAHRAGVKRSGLKSIFQGLARKGCEVRVPVKVTPSGKPVFAYEGTAVTFKVPHLAKRGGHSIPTEKGCQSNPTEQQEGMPQHPRGEAVASNRGGHSHPQSLKTLKEPSKTSLSDARTSVPAARVPVEDRERDEVTASEDQNLTWHQQLVIDAGCPPHLAADVSDRLQVRYPDRGPGWWRKLLGNGDLAELVKETVLTLTGPLPGQQVADFRCPVHPEYWWHNCTDCRTAVDAGLDPFEHDPRKRPADWYGMYQWNQQARSSDPNRRQPGPNYLPDTPHRQTSQSSEGRNYDGWTQDIKAQIQAAMAANNYPMQ